MEIMINGQLVTCTPKEYVELQQLGVLPSPPPSNGTDLTPWNTPKQGFPWNEPKLPDDIKPLPEGDTSPKPHNWNDDYHVVPLYGCVVDQRTIKLEPSTPIVQDKMPQVEIGGNGTIHISVSDTSTNSASTDNTTDDLSKRYVLKETIGKGYWSSKTTEYFTQNLNEAWKFNKASDAMVIMDYLQTNHYGAFTVEPYQGES